ncbi:MAG: hypothetical protein M0R74_10585 [Dehalococcoidia bacterium]|nr:hypothetical protein [Dehalococcoidia bacterium]
MLAELRDVLNAYGSTFAAWSDTRLLGYLAEGQDKFCEETGFFIDKTNYSVILETGTRIYTIPDRIIQILEVWDGTRKLEKLLTGEVFDGTIAAGDPAKWTTDQETADIEFDRAPTSDEDGDTFTLRVWRYSRYALDVAGKEPEIPSRFHRACIEWAAYKALNHHDAETQDPVKAKDHKDAFYDEYVTDGIAFFRRYHNIETRVGCDPAYQT